MHASELLPPQRRKRRRSPGKNCDMQGKATLGGHSIHPALVRIPVGCFVAAVTCDIISVWAGPVFWAAMATWLICFGLAGALLSAGFGFVDYLSAPMTLRAKNAAGWHATLNAALIVVWGAAFALRAMNHTSSIGYALTGLGFLILIATVYLGGEVAHGHLVGVSEADRDERRRPVEQTSDAP